MVISGEPDKQIENVYLSDSPALTVFKDKLYLAYQGKDFNHQFWYITTCDGVNWSEPIQISNIRLSCSPALAVFNNKLYVVYQDENEKGQLWYTTTYDGEVWTEQKQIQNVGMSYSPALAVFDDKLYLAHQGPCRLGKLWYTATNDGEKWHEEKQTKSSYILCMSYSPALAGFGDSLYLAYAGPMRNGNIWYTKACVKGFLRVSLKDFSFEFPSGGIEKYLQDKKQLIEMVSTQRLNVVDDRLRVNVSNLYERSIQETFSWGLAQKLGIQASFKVNCNVAWIAGQETTVTASFEASANQNWSTSRTRKFTVTAGMAPEEKGVYELGLKVYCVNDLELPFTATAKLTATTGIYEGGDTVHQTDRKLNAEIAEALFKNSNGDMEKIIERNEEKKYIKGIMKGKMKATYGVLQEVIARKIEPIIESIDESEERLMGKKSSSGVK
jgi:hypothetical protein